MKAFDDTMTGLDGVLALVSLGPGDFLQMTGAAQAALQTAEVVIGYQVYIDSIRPLLSEEQEIISSPIGQELERAGQAIELAAAGRRVAMISSGDIGIYAMASPVFDLLQEQGWSGRQPVVEVYPGVSAIQAAAARLGAPLGHDFCTISLSDLLTPWPVIERRLQAAAWGDFVIGFYNPRSRQRDWQLQRAVDILRAYRPGSTPVAVVRNVTRPDERIDLTTLADFEPEVVDMFTLVLVGNSQSYVLAQRIVTPRGYVDTPEATTEREPTKVASNRITEPQPQGDLYPLTLTGMRQVRAVVVGGGPVGQRKVQGLLNSGAIVRLISPEATPTLATWAEAGKIEWVRRPFQTGDVEGAQLVFAATNQRAVNAQVAQEAARLELLCNVADRPDEGNFHVPAVHRQPDLVVSVSTISKRPTQARQVRDKIRTWLENGDLDIGGAGD